MKSSNLFLLVLGTLALTVARSAAGLIYDESLDGDLSGNENAPTFLNFSLGTNRITGVMGDDEPGFGPPLDRDFFTFTLDPGELLTAINVTQFQLLGGSGSFYAISAGTSIDINSPSNHLSNLLINGTGDILPILDASSYSGGLGLTAPLGAGTYTVWFQELSALVPYQFEYEVTAVPEPGTAIFGMLLGITAVAHRRRGRSIS